MKDTTMRLTAMGLALLFCLCVAGPGALADVTVYSANFNILDSGMLDVSDVQPAPAQETPAPAEAAERGVLVTCDMPDLLKLGQTFTLQAELTGYEGLKPKLQWQYYREKDEDGDGVSDGWLDAPGKSRRPLYRVKVTEETMKTKWRVRVTLEE